MTGLARLARSSLAAFAVAAAPAFAGPIEGSEVASRVVTIGPKQFLEVDVHCPPPLVVLSVSVTPLNMLGTFVLAQEALLGDGAPPSTDGLYGAAYGVRVTLYNAAELPDFAVVQVQCGRPAVGIAVALVAASLGIAPGVRDQTVARCPAGTTATGGGFSAKALALLRQHLHLRNPPYYVIDRADGTYDEGPVGWETWAENPGSIVQTLRSYAFCWALSSVQTRIASLALEPGERRFFGLAVPDSATIVGGGVAAGENAFWRADAWWLANLGVMYYLSGLRWPQEANRPDPIGYGLAMQPKAGGPAWRGGGLIGSFMQDRRTAGSAGAATPLKIAVVTIPTEGPVPPTSVVQVVEYYNAARDHWFMTSIPKEIADLDAGVHAGWVRTGKTFNAYATGSGGPVGRLPFCRYYGLPEFGLDSHFYTGSILECLDVAAKFRGAWGLESAEVFQVSLPNAQTGACPAGTVAVYRTWNGRTDSNHRYMTDPALRAQMLAAGHVPEGYGPDGVAFCALA